MKKIYVLISLFLSSCLYCQNANNLDQPPKIDLKVSYEKKTLIYSIETNISLPIEVMIGIGSSSSKPEDPAYGFSKRVKIDKSPTKFTVDAKDTYGYTSTDLKSGTYIADVTFYPTWGAKGNNIIAKKIKSKVVGTSIVEIGTNKKGDLINSEIDKSIKQTWGMRIAIKDKWIKKNFIKNLGMYEELKTKGRDPAEVKTYYFPEADMTFFISKKRNEVLMWKFGKVDNL